MNDDDRPSKEEMKYAGYVFGAVLSGIALIIATLGYAWRWGIGLANALIGDD